MSYKETTYVAHKPDKNGDVVYTDEENQIWAELLARQLNIIQNRACDEYIHGLNLLNLPHDRVPQCREISEVLLAQTGWRLQPVPALIPFDYFFSLLAERKFPAATFIRHRAQLNYLEEPDIFHEIFGHCALLTNPGYAKFAEIYGKLGVNATHADRIMLARLYWFTIEFGLIQTPEGLRAYGGGILSSVNETLYCLESPLPARKPFDPLDALRTPYRIDKMQTIYFVLNHFDTLYELTNLDLIKLIKKARQLGEYPVQF